MTAQVYRIQTVSAVADGAVLTTVVLYFSQVVGLPAGAVGTVLAAAAAASLLAAAPLGRLADRIGLRRAAVGYSLSLAVALLGYTVAGSMWSYAAAGIGFGVARSGLAATLQAIVASQTAPDQRVQARARLHTVLNGGFGLGSVIGAVALAAHRPPLFIAIFGAAALSSVCCAGMFLRLEIAAPVSAGRSGARAALRDRRLLAVTALSSVLLLTIPILSVLLPLWLTRTSAPLWVAALAFGLNTVIVFLLQSPWSARVRTDAQAGRSALTAGAAIATAGVLFAAVPSFGAVAASVVALAGVAVMTIGEVATGPAAWHLALRDAPAEQQGEYQAVFGMSFSAARILGPLVALPLIATLGATGWLAIALAVLAAAGGLSLVGSPRRAYPTSALAA